MEIVLFIILNMLKKRLGLEAIERSRLFSSIKIPSSLIIPEGCVRIGNWAFWGCRWLKEVIIPKSVVEIGMCAFEGCERLEKIEIPESVKEIGFEAFENCIKLKKVKIPESVKRLGYATFKNCKNLREIEIPGSVKVIGIEAFRNCDNADITLKKAKNKFNIGSRAFEGCKDIRYIKYAKEEIRD